MRLKFGLDPTARDLVLIDIEKCLVFILRVWSRWWRGEPWWSAVWRCLSPLHPPCPLVVSVCKRLVKQTVKGVEHCIVLQLTKVTEFWQESKWAARKYHYGKEALWNKMGWRSVSLRRT